jgi:hypothetical protein
LPPRRDGSAQHATGALLVATASPFLVADVHEIVEAFSAEQFHDLVSGGVATFLVCGAE